MVPLTPPWSFSAFGGNPGFESFVPAHFTFDFGDVHFVYATFHDSSPATLAVMDVVVPRPTLPLVRIELKTVVTEAIFGIMGAAVLQW